MPQHSSFKADAETVASSRLQKISADTLSLGLLAGVLLELSTTVFAYRATG